MAKHPNLRNFQEHLAGRLNAARGTTASQTWLSLQIGEEGWLVDLEEGGEIVQDAEQSPVPLTQPWFAGLTNIRGNLYAVTDFSAFCGGRPQKVAARNRILLIGHKFGSNAALLVAQIIGLRKPDDFREQESDEQAPAWGCRRYADGFGKIWHWLDVRQLLADPHFMNIAR